MVLLIVFIGLLSISAYFMIKNENAYYQHLVILNAIYEYGKNIIRNDGDPSLYEGLYDRMEPYWKTLLRFWDWGYKRILPKESYEIIKDYIKK